MSGTEIPTWDEGIAHLLARLPEATAAGALTVNDIRTIHYLEQRIRELSEELVIANRRWDRLAMDCRTLTAKVIAGLSTPEHRMTVVAGLPVCQCGESLDGGDASGAFITHALAVLAASRAPASPWIPADPDGLPPRSFAKWREQEIERRRSEHP